MKTNFLRSGVAGTAIMLIMFFSNCKKNDYQPGARLPFPPGPSSLHEFHQNNQVRSQVFSIDAAAGGTFTGNKGTIFTFPPNAFVTKSGQPVSGTVSIEIKEVYAKSDMILMDKPTMNGTHLLKSGGEYYIRATSGSAEVQMAPGITYTAEMPADSIEWGMGVFVDDNGGGFYPPTWMLADSSMNYVIPQTNPDPKYILTCHEFKWINCDYFWNVSSTANLIVNVPDSIAKGEIDVYLVFKDKAVAEVYYPKPYIFYDMPQNYSATIVALYIKDNRMWSAFQPIVIKSNLSVNLNLMETYEAKFIEQLRLLD
jgi:hypothetical protein